VTHLRKLTLDEIARRNYTKATTRAYLRIIEEFARYFHRPPDQLGPDEIREYTAHLFRDRKLSDNTVNQTIGALRFFFIKTLKRPLARRRNAVPEEENSSARDLESG
jgi:integrase/recombinase XerD